MRLNNSRGFMANHNFIARVCKGGGGGRCVLCGCDADSTSGGTGALATGNN